MNCPHDVFDAEAAFDCDGLCALCMRPVFDAAMVAWASGLFWRHPDNWTEDELQEMGALDAACRHANEQAALDELTREGQKRGEYDPTREKK